MRTEKPKQKVVIVQLAEYLGSKYIKGTNHRIPVYDSTHTEVFKVVKNALDSATKDNTLPKTKAVKK